MKDLRDDQRTCVMISLVPKTEDSDNLLSRKLIRRIVAALWVFMCVWLLIRTLLVRNASPKLFGDMEEAELLGMLGLSAPTSLLYTLTTRWLTFSWWIYPENDARSIFGGWLCLFAVGCLQWFVLVPWVVHKWFDVYDSVLSRRRKRQQS
jgi:hypothetical protein